jgi:hypothetical protein
VTSLSAVGAVPDQSTTLVTSSMLSPYDAAPSTAEASRDPVRDDASSGPCVVCGVSTHEAVRPMGWLTEPIWCCQEHDDRVIVRAWIHQLPDWQQLQAACPSECRTCGGRCHCAGHAPDRHRCACWPPTADGHARGQPTRSPC